MKICYQSLIFGFLKIKKKKKNSWKGPGKVLEFVRADLVGTPFFIPSKEFELTASSLGAHTETHGKLISRTLSYLTVNSQDDSHCELAVSFL